MHTDLSFDEAWAAGEYDGQVSRYFADMAGHKIACRRRVLAEIERRAAELGVSSQRDSKDPGIRGLWREYDEI